MVLEGTYYGTEHHTVFLMELLLFRAYFAVLEVNILRMNIVHHRWYLVSQPPIANTST